MRLAAYEDSIYSRADGVLSVHQAFPRFMFELAGAVDQLVVLGRLDPEPARSHYALPDTAEFVPLPFYASLTAPIAVLKAVTGTMRRFWRVLGRVDAIWLNGPSPIALAVVPLAALRRRRIVLGVRQNTVEYARSRHPGNLPAQLALRGLELSWRIAARFTGVTAVGDEIAGLYRRSRRVHALSVSLVAEQGIAGPEVAAARDYAGEIRVLSVGRLDTEKNPLLLADVLRRLVDGGGAWRLLVVGEGGLTSELRERLDALGIGAHAELLGYVPLDDGLDDLYRAAHVFLHVSWTEGLPQVLLEAFGARLPVAATDVGGVRALAESAAVLFPPGEARAAAAAVRALVEDAALRDRLVAEGVDRVRERTTEAEVRRLVAFIRGS